MFYINRFLWAVGWLLAAASPIVADTPSSVFMSGELSNGFDYSIYKSDDSLTELYDEDVSLQLYIGIGANQENAEQAGFAKLIGKAAKDVFDGSRDKESVYHLNLHDINDQKLADALQLFKTITTGKLFLDANVSDAQAEVGKAFINKWYQPQFMHLAVAGQIDVAKVKAQIEAIFGTLKSTPVARTPIAFYQPHKGLNHVVKPQEKQDMLRVLLEISQDIDPREIEGGPFAYAVASIMIRSHLRITAEENADFEYSQDYLNWRGPNQYLQITLRHDGKALQGAEWIATELDAIRKEGISKGRISSLGMWLVAEGIDHFSPFVPDGKPEDITSNLIRYENSNPIVPLSSEKQFGQAKKFIRNVYHVWLDKLLKRMLSGKMRIVTVGNKDISPALRAQLEKFIGDYNAGK